MDNAMALPGEVLPSIAVIILVPPTLTEEYAVSTPTVLTPVGDEEFVGTEIVVPNDTVLIAAVCLPAVS